MFSPNAAELGKYGMIPVSYFNGLPDITIPLTELKAKDYTLPVYLSYHAGGNKPDQHPGWVGLGWTLHAGGCINRIVNGMKDETTMWEYKDRTGYQPGRDPGYYHHCDFVQSNDWSSQDMNSGALDISHQDYEPDEFLVCAGDLQFSFYIAGKDSVRIVGKSAEIAEVHVSYHDEFPRQECIPLPIMPFPENELLSLYGKRFPYFEKIEVIRSDGRRYVFGGSENALEFSTEILPQYELLPFSFSSWINKNEWKAISSVNTWMLDRIEFPGGECIRFTYEKDGTPLVRHDFHHAEYFHRALTPSLLPFNLIPDVDDDGHHPHYDTESTSPVSLQNISFTLLQPSYLTRISCDLSGDYLTFSSTPSQELKYPTTREEFELRAGDYSEDYGGETFRTFEEFQAMDYYKHLDTIHGKRDSITLFYNDCPQERLHLESVRKWAGSMAVQKYDFHYNGTLLPAYHARQTDVYGYYNGRCYRNVLRPEMTSFRMPDEEKMQAEMLISIDYPTGGHTEFTYEAHRYAKEAIQFPFDVVTVPSDTLAGGLRIRETRDYTAEGVLAVRRTFSYLSAENRSSGILSGRPVNYLRGNHTTEFRWGPSTASYYDGVYELFSEGPLRPLSETDGNHVTYSQVQENFDDGSYTIYRYSNHDTADALDLPPYILGENVQEHLLVNSFSSRELSRGLLLSREDHRQDGALVRKEECGYRSDTTQCLLAVGYHAFAADWIKTYSVYKFFTYFPSLRTKTLTTYPDTGAPHVETFEYTYDDHRRLKESRHTVAGVTDRETFTYTGDYDAEPYTSMKTKNMVSLPVEHLTFHRGSPSAAEKVVGAELTTWKSSGALYVPSEEWKAALGPGIPTSSFAPFTGTTKDERYGSVPECSFTAYDEHGNLLRSADRTGTPVTYFWDKDGVHPVFIARDAVNGTRTCSVPERVSTSETDTYTSVRRVVKQFTSTERGPFSLRFIPEVPASEITATLDGDTLALQTLSAFGGPILEYSYQTHPGSSNALPAGEHEILITCLPALQEAPTGSTHNATNGLVIHPIPFSGTLHISYSIHCLRAQSFDAEDLLFEDFETASGGAAGYHSGKGHSGSYTVSLPDLNPYREHVLDYRSRTGTGAWTYIRVPFTGSATIGGPGVTVDQVRVYPADALVESYTWDSRGNLLSRTDSRGVTESFTYDALGRLTGVFDNDGNKIEEYQYNYKKR